MNIPKNSPLDEQIVLEKIKKTTFFLYKSLIKKDFEAAKIEIHKLQESLNIYEQFKIKRIRKEKLFQVIREMRKKGIVIDFASRSPFFKDVAKKADEKC